MLPAINVRNETRIFIAHSPWDSLNKSCMPIMRSLNPVDAIKIKPTRFFYAWENISCISGNYTTTLNNAFYHCFNTALGINKVKTEIFPDYRPTIYNTRGFKNTVVPLDRAYPLWN